MTSTLLLARHGRADGMHAEASLTHEGESAVRRLAARLLAEALPPDAACVSPYRRARQTMAGLLLGLDSRIEPQVVSDLMPDSEADEALLALQAHGLGTGRLLVVSHMPLVSAITRRLTGEDHGFMPGHLVEIALEEGAKHGRLLRAFPPAD